VLGAPPRRWDRGQRSSSFAFSRGSVAR
jgi:hypothetical protein